MSNRRSFLKQILTCAAAWPAILTSLEYKAPVVPTKIKRACYFKVTPELIADKEGLNYTINEQASLSGIDLSKEFSYQIGYVNDDFIYNNLLTCVITQYQ